MTSGTFRFSAVADVNDVLQLELAPNQQAAAATTPSEQQPEAESAGGAAVAADPAAAAALRTHGFDYLQDLRSKLIMTEVPAELEEEMPVKAMIEAFVEQLQVLSDTRDAIHKLFISGHFRFQGGFTVSHPFVLDGLPALRASLVELEAESEAWTTRQRRARNQFAFLCVELQNTLLVHHDVAGAAGRRFCRAPLPSHSSKTLACQIPPADLTSDLLPPCLPRCPGISTRCASCYGWPGCWRSRRGRELAA